MFSKNYLLERVTAMDCFGCFGFTNKTSRVLRPNPNTHFSLERLLDQSGAVDDEEEEEEEGEGDRAYDVSNYGEITNTGAGNEDDSELQNNNAKRSEEIIRSRIQNGLICREVPVKETVKVIRSEDENGNKMINEYVREYKIGSGSYGKVVLYRSSVDGKHYAIKAFHKSRLKKTPVGLSETAMTDVLREVLIMKVLKHPNIVNLVEVIDDPSKDQFYMVLEYVESKLVFEGFGSPGGLEENKARKYLRDIVSGLMYLHAHHIIHGDIKPDNLLVTSSGNVKIGDFSVSQVFEDENDELRRSPGTIVFTAPECCLGLTYHGKTADIWAVGVTLYYMVLGQYPFIGDGWQDTYDKIVNNPLSLPDDLNPHLKFLIEGLLCKDPKERLTLEAVAEHAWVMGDNGPIPQYLCWCKRSRWQTEQPSNGITAQDTTQYTEAQMERESNVNGKT